MGEDIGGETGLAAGAVEGDAAGVDTGDARGLARGLATGAPTGVAMGDATGAGPPPQGDERAHACCQAVPVPRPYAHAGPLHQLAYMQS